MGFTPAPSGFCVGDAVPQGTHTPGPVAFPLTANISSSPTKLFCSISVHNITPAPPGTCPSPQSQQGEGMPLSCPPQPKYVLFWCAKKPRNIKQNPAGGDGRRCLYPHRLISSHGDALDTQVLFQASVSPVNSSAAG